MKKRKFAYILKVDGKEVWRGSEPTEKLFDDIRKKNPSKEVGICVDLGNDLFIGINSGRMN